MLSDYNLKLSNIRAARRELQNAINNLNQEEKELTKDMQKACPHLKEHKKSRQSFDGHSSSWEYWCSCCGKEL